MAKRFVDTDRYRKSLRGVDCKIRLAHEWLWQNCDQAGVWITDLDLFKFECGYKLEVDALLKACPWVRQLPNGALFITDYIDVNCGKLKEGYNPHKPVFRSLEANGIDPLTLQFQDLPNPCQRVVDVDVEEDNTQGKKERASEPDTVADDFEALWIVYERYGAKGKALAYYRKLSQEDRDAIHAKAAEYVASTHGCEYRKQLEGWINPDNRLWERPIVKRNTATNGQQTDEQRRQERNRIIAERYAGQ